MNTIYHINIENLRFKFNDIFDLIDKYPFLSLSEQKDNNNKYILSWLPKLALFWQENLKKNDIKNLIKFNSIQNN